MNILNILNSLKRHFAKSPMDTFVPITESEYHERLGTYFSNSAKKKG